MPSTQSFLPIKQIREGTVVLESKALRGILMVSSQNFALKSREEQKAIISRFQGFLNTLDFSCQIVVQSRRLNLSGYLEGLEELEEEQEEELLEVQTKEYRKFIKDLLSQGIIMSKKFFVSIPFTFWDIKEKRKGGLLKRASVPKMTEDMFRRCRSQLWQRMEFVAMGLRDCGLKSVPLKSAELIELFWRIYHPRQAEIGHYPRIPPELLH